MKLNSNFKTFAAVKFDATKYISSPSYGVNRFMLDRIGNEKARATTVVQYQPKSSFPEHEHFGGEEFLVLEGTFKDQFGEFPAGTYVRNPIGSKHSPWVDEDGCTILVKLLQMAETGEGTTPLHVYTTSTNDNNGDDDNNKRVATDYGSVLDMYQNDVTGERVQMCWVNAGQIMTADEYCNGGEELFIYDGSLIVGDEEYAKWGWLRFPASDKIDDKRAMIKSGSNGAQVYRKTGHLTEKAMSMEKIQIKEEDDD